ncbi:MAG: hypothetical protein HY318_04610 [Armatimonadetes bacterium]|nr:hypothetical protein [Armatimonadota bacterium]
MKRLLLIVPLILLTVSSCRDERFDKHQWRIVRRYSTRIVQVGKRRYKTRWRWVTTRDPQTQRPLDIYLVKNRLGAFIDFPDNPAGGVMVPKDKILLSIKKDLENTLAELGVRDESVVVGFKACNFYKKSGRT